MKKFVLIFACSAISMLSWSQSWNLTGNAGTNPTTNFVGTTDNQPLRFRVANRYSGEIDSVTTKTFFGYGSGKSVTTGIFNVGMGFKSLYSNTSTSFNSAYGAYSLYTNNANYNTGLGYAALYLNNTGYENTGIGYSALYSNTTGDGETAVGSLALYYNTSGRNNTAVGKSALQTNTTGTNNVAVGSFALTYSTTGWDNVGVGINALINTSSGSSNVAIGSRAVTVNTTGWYNTGIGYFALSRATGSQYNTCVGSFTGDSYNMGWNNTLIGANCDVSFADQYNAVAVGQGTICPDNSTARIGNSATWSIGGYAGWSNFSDGRYKKDVKTDVKGIDFIMKLQPITYHLDVNGISKKVNENKGQEWDEAMKQSIAEKEKMVFSGFAAQEVERAANEVGYNFSGVDKPRREDGFYGLRYADFVVPLVKGMQEQQQQIVELKEIISSLQKRLADVEKQCSATGSLTKGN